MPRAAALALLASLLSGCIVYAPASPNNGASHCMGLPAVWCIYPMVAGAIPSPGGSMNGCQAGAQAILQPTGFTATTVPANVATGNSFDMEWTVTDAVNGVVYATGTLTFKRDSSFPAQTYQTASQAPPAALFTSLPPTGTTVPHADCYRMDVHLPGCADKTCGVFWLLYGT
jgi:hypothetical protein